MDTTADTYLYAGVRMIREVWIALDHPVLAAVVQLLGAGIIAWMLSERWQRWRQRREFQHRALVEFSETSIAVLTLLHRIMRGPWNMRTEDWNQLTRDFAARFQALAARDGQLYAVFEERILVNELYTLTTLMNRLTQKGIEAAQGSTPLPMESMQKPLKCVTARRRLIIGRMAAEMRLRSPDAFSRLLQELAPDLTPPPEFADIRESDRSGQPVSSLVPEDDS